jgi:uncharacterized membrane protein
MTEFLGNRRWWFVLLFGAMTLAAGLRIAFIGKWSFASDELGTFKDVQEFETGAAYPDDNPDKHLPRMIPLAMWLHALGYSMFGTDEAGSRTLPMLCGLAQVLIVGLCLRNLIGRGGAIAVVLLLALSPEHIFYCQYHRFYTLAALFASIAMLAAARAMKDDSHRWMLVAVAVALAGVLVHTLLGLVLGELVLAALLVRLNGGSARSLRPLFVILVGSLAAAAFAGLYLYPLGKGKAVDYVWSGYSAQQALFSGVVQVGWPTLLLALPGFLLLWRRDRVQAIFWGSQSLMWLGALLVLPRILPFHSGYVFAFCLPIFVCAGVAIAELVEWAASLGGRLVASGVLAALLLVNLPALASYYQDGNRHDFRAAANWVGDRVGPNDFIVAVQGDKLTHYRPELAGRWQRPPNKDVDAWLAARRPANGRVWIVLPGGRSGLPEPWREWAERTGRMQTTIVHRRFDYHEYPVFILLEDRPASRTGDE